MTKSHLHRRKAARRTGYDEGLAAGEAERNNLNGKYQSIVVLLDAARRRIQEIFDHLDDEGDRVYLGSTNHRDWLLDMLDHMDRWSFDAMLPKGDINKMECDPYAEIRSQRARAEAAEVELNSRTRELDEAESEATRLRDASANLIASASDTYKKRNGHLASFEDESGEKCWIVPFDAFEALRSALTAQVQDVADSAFQAIADERLRQIRKGYDAAHDDRHVAGEIISATWGASARLWDAQECAVSGDIAGYKKYLIQAAAQIVAEYGRVERAAAPAKQEGGE